MASSCQRFLPFRQARAHVHQIGLQTQKEWRAWCKTKERAQSIPTDPERVYGKLWVNTGDWLGRNEFRANPVDDVPTSSCRQQLGFSEGISAFLLHAKEHAPDFEFSLMPHESTATFLTRPVGTSDESWVPLAIRTVRERENGMASFTDLQRETMSHFLGFEVSRSALYFFRTTPDLPTSVHISSRNGRNQAKYGLPSARLTDVLLNHWKTHDQRRRRDWLAPEMFRRHGDHLWAASVADAWRVLYEPLEMQVHFCTYGGSSKNVCVGEWSVLHRRVCEQENQATGATTMTVKLTKYVNSHKSPIYVRDDVDIFVFARLRTEISGNNIPVLETTSRRSSCRGLYVFPKSVLKEHKILRNPDEKVPGKYHVSLYPPDSTPKIQQTKKKQLWQNEYYLDLSSEDAIEESKSKFLNILNTVSK